MIRDEMIVRDLFYRARSERPNISVLLFDLDGTLLETMDLHYEAYRRAFHDYGKYLSREDFDRLSGPPAKITIPGFFQAAGLPIPSDADIRALHQRKKDIFHDVLEEQAPTALPTLTWMRSVKDQFRMGLVTSGNRSGATRLLVSALINDCFEVIITGDDVTQGKPAAEPYQLAVDCLDVDPTSVLAFEDHPNGVTSALAAGIAVIDVVEGKLMTPIERDD